MVSYFPVDPERHGGKGWCHAPVYTFAATQTVAPLVGAEFAMTAVAMPIAFVRQDDSFLPVAILSPIQGQNFFVGPNGHWLGSYVPASLRIYPFRLARQEGADQVSLCIDEDSGLIVDADNNPDTSKFFEPDGKPSAALIAIWQFIQQIELSRVATNSAVAALAECNVIAPWPLTVHDGKQQVTINGLFQIDEAALNALDDESFGKLRKASALALGYSQLVSMHTLNVFRQFGMLQQQLAQKAKPLPSVSSLFPVDDGGTIRFN
jgi:hypothetical protein